MYPSVGILNSHWLKGKVNKIGLANPPDVGYFKFKQISSNPIGQYSHVTNKSKFYFFTYSIKNIKTNLFLKMNIYAIL